MGLALGLVASTEPRPVATMEEAVMGQSETWMIVRKDARIPGGWRVVHSDLSENDARRMLLWYDRSDYAAMLTSRLYDLRKVAMGLA